MMKNDIGYKEATKDLYLNELPTTHHVDMLVNDSNVIYKTSITGSNKNVLLQVVEGNIAQQLTHSILNVDKHLTHTGDFASLIVEECGVKARQESDNYICQKGPLEVGEVISLSPGNLRSFYLFHSVWTGIRESEPDENAVNNYLVESLSLARKYLCKSISIPAIRFSQNAVNKTMNILNKIISGTNSNSVGSLEVIRVVGNHKGTLHLYQKALYTPR